MFFHRRRIRRNRPRGSTPRQRRVTRRRPWVEIVIKLREEIRANDKLLFEASRDPEGNFRLIAGGDEVEGLPGFLRSPDPGHSLAQSFPRFSRRLHDREPALVLAGERGRGSLDLYLRLRLLRPTQHLRPLLRAVRDIPMVEYAIPTWGAAVQTASIPSHPATSNQLYLEPGMYGGVDAVYAWMSGADGSWDDASTGDIRRIKVCVLERDMCPHPDLPEVTILGGDPQNPSIGDTRHGTRTCGVLAGLFEAEPAGVTGICHGAEFFLHTMIPSVPAPGDPEVGPFGAGLESLPRSIDEAIDSAGLGAGDVLAIEMHIDPMLTDTLIPDFEIPSLATHQWPTLLPVEIIPDVWECIRRATDAGITVVEAAGNGGGELVPMIWREDGPGSPAIPLWDPADDSGAILVGAGTSSLPSDVAPAQSRTGVSNWGPRVDCQGWGEDVYTTDCPDEGYAHHSGTSSATAMVTGIVAALQSGWYRHFGQFLDLPGFRSPDEIRDALRDDTLGSPQPDAGHIGPLPDLCLLLSDLGIAPDPFLRDAVGDDGQAVVLADGTGRFQAKCPDVILRQRPIPEMSAEDWEVENVTDPASAAGPNHLRVRVRNRGAGGDDPEVVVYWSEPAAFVHPTSWKEAGAAELPFLGPGGVAEVDVPWDVPPLEDLPVSLVVHVRSSRAHAVDAEGNRVPPIGAGDDIPTEEFLARLIGRNDLRIRNVQEVLLPSRGTEAGLRFHFRGVPGQDEDYRLVVTNGLPAGSKVTVSVRSALSLSTPDGPQPAEALTPANPWTDQPVSREYALHLAAGEDVRFDAHVTVPVEAGGGTWRSSVDQFLGDQFLGRMEFVVRRNSLLGIL